MGTIKFCIVSTRSHDFDGTQLDTPFFMPIMYSLFRPEVLEFDTFSEAYRYASRLNEVCRTEAFKIVPLKRGQKYAEQVVDRYRECKQRKDAARKRNAVVLNLGSLRSKLP